MARNHWRTVTQLVAAILIAGTLGMMIGQARPITVQLGPLAVEPQHDADATALAIATHFMRARGDLTIFPRSIGNHAADIIEEYVDEIELTRATVSGPGDGYALAVAYQALLVRDGQLPGPGKTAEFAAAMSKRYRLKAGIGREKQLTPADGMAMSAAYQAIISRDEAAKITPRYLGEFAADIIDKFRD